MICIGASTGKIAKSSSDIFSQVLGNKANTSDQTIYLSDSLFQVNSGDPLVGGAAEVLTEEIFHWLDDRVGADIQGDVCIYFSLCKQYFGQFQKIEKKKPFIV
jgi:hypothetical protein